MSTPIGRRIMREKNLKLGLYKYLANSIEKSKKKIVELDLDGNYIRTWESIRSAMRETGLQHIHHCVKKKRNKCGDRMWMYLEEWEELNNENNSGESNKD